MPIKSRVRSDLKRDVNEAKEVLKQLLIQLNIKQDMTELIDREQFNLSYYEWTKKFRKIVEGKTNVLEYLPFWVDIYNDPIPWLMLVLGRQTGKTTYGGGRLAYYGTQDHTKSIYITFSDESLRSFSNDKFRGSLIHPDNPILYSAVRGSLGDKGAVSRVEFITDSSVSLVTHANKMHHVVGKSADFIFADEVQELDLESFQEAQDSQSWTQGSKLFAGVGGYIGSMQHKYWLSTNQNEWEYKEQSDYTDSAGKVWPAQGWRHKLKFNDKGFEWGNYLKSVLEGKWVPKTPQNWTKHGYRLPQNMMPNIPVSIADALNLYKINEEYSIEYKRDHFPQSYFYRNDEAQFVKGDKKPFTKDMILRLFDRNLSFTKPDDVDHKKGKVYASSDWGGGSAAFTVPMIAQCLHPKAPVFKILYITRMDEPDVEKQADQFINLCNAYEVDAIGVDAGGGARQAQKTELTFADRCTRISYRERPQQPLPTETEMDHLRKENRFSIDRTYSLDRLKDMLENPFLQGKYAYPRFIIPAADLQKVAWIADDFEAIEGELIKLKSTGQDYIRYDNPHNPDDAAHTFNYMWITQMLDQDSEIYFKSF